MKKSSPSLFFFALLPALSFAQDAAVNGEAVYSQYCASCHDQTEARIVTREAIERMSPERILRTLDFGAMMTIAYPMRRDERLAVASYLGQGEDESRLPADAYCAADRAILTGDSQAGWRGWSPTADNTRYQSAAAAGITAADVGRLELRWAFGFPGDVIAFAAPTLVNGTLFVGSAGGMVYAIDAGSGCVHWQYDARGPVRAAPVVAGDGDSPTLLFSDQNGGVHAIHARTGEQQWRVRVEEHEATRLTGSFALADGLVFVPAASWEETRSINPEYECCTFRGSVTALRIADGSRVWKTYFVDEPVRTGATSVGTATFGPSGAGVWSTPTVDPERRLLYVTTGDNYSHPATAMSDAIVALDLDDGHIVWSQQTTPNDVYNSSCGTQGPNCPEDRGPDYDFGAAAILLSTPAGGEVLVAGQKSGVVFGLDPDDDGRLLWQTRVGEGGVNGGVQWGMASDGDYVYASVSDVVRPRGLMARPGAVGNAPLDPERGGGLTALRLADGSRVWHAPGRACEPPKPGCSPAQPGALTAIEGAVFSGSLDGHLRAFSTENGRVLWDFDTARDYTTVNGVTGTGGSLDGAGPVIAGGMLFVNSGYPRFGGMPGNVLLAFGLAAR
ncbi:MAG TPA: PQQ-binding-like beta-propeller repeat protein [Gammaproteobacteria bacterium]